MSKARLRLGWLGAALQIACLAIGHAVVETLERIAMVACDPVSMAKAEAELAQNAAAETPAIHKKPSGGTGESPLGFVSMLKDLNSRGFAAAC